MLGVHSRYISPLAPPGRRRAGGAPPEGCGRRNGDITGARILVVTMTDEEEGRRVVPAEEILGKIERGEKVDCNNIIIEGNLELGTCYLLRLNFESEIKTFVTSLVRIRDSVIRGDLNFDNTIFLNFVDFKGTRFEGKVSFSKAKFHNSAIFSSEKRKTYFKNYVNFQDANFLDFTHFDGVTFEMDANFKHARFKNVVFFRKAIFCQTADFGGATFENHTSFKETNFNARANFAIVDFGICLEDLGFRNGSPDNWGAANFIKSTFCGYADFSQANLNGDPNFSNATFEAEANFMMTNFFGDTIFSHVIFKNIVIFNHSRFYNHILINGVYKIGDHSNEVNFTDVEFYKQANFTRDVIFFVDVKFWNSHFGGKALFRDCRFCGISDFSGCEFNKDAFFRKAFFNKAAIFWGSRFYEDAYFNKAIFNNNINLKESRFNRFDVEWASIKEAISHKDNDRAVYLSLIKNFKELGYFDDADDCIYIYRLKFSDSNDQIERISRLIQYGVKLRNSFILIILGSFLLIMTTYRYNSVDLRIVISELILFGILIPVFIVLLARKLIR